MNGILKKIAVIEDKATGMFSEKYRLRRSDGKRVPVIVAPSEAQNLTKFRALLLDMGAPAKIASTDIIDATSMDVEKLTYAAATGWLGDQFVLQDRVVGSLTGEIVGVSFFHQGDGDRGKTKYKASTNEWKASVGVLSKASTAAMFSICAAFAAPFLRFTDEETVAINLYGPGGSGKSLATLAGSSVIGIGKPKQLLTWFATKNGLEQYLRPYNDCLLPIDDFSKLDATSAREALNQIDNLSYNFMSGTRKSRHETYQAKKSQSYHVLVLTSSEKSISEMAHDQNTRRKGGSTRRLIDVAACYDGRADIFDRKKFINEDARRAHLQKFWKACGACYGSVFKSYLSKVLTRKKHVRKSIGESTDLFVKLVAREDDTEINRDIARKFGLIYSAGIIAIKLGVLPWSRKLVKGVVLKAYHSTRSMNITDDQVLLHGRKRLRATLNDLPNIDDIAKHSLANVEGFKTVIDGHTRATIKVKEYAKVFVNSHQRELTEKFLLDRRFMTPIKKGAGDKLEPKNQITWPDGVRRHSHEFDLGRRKGKT